MPRVFCLGESLIRYDIEQPSQVAMMVVGTGLNVAASLARLGENDLYLISANSKARDGALLSDFAAQNKLDLTLCPSFDASLGSYQLYRTASTFGWEVVYNRKHSPWSLLMDDWAACSARVLALIQPGDLVHCDGITLLTHRHGYANLLSLLQALAAKKVLISFDFNLRASLVQGREDELIAQVKQILSLATYSNIGQSDLQKLTGSAALDAGLGDALFALFPNLQAVYGYQKSFSLETLTLSAYLLTKAGLVRAMPLTFSPREPIGLGDAFSAYVLNDLLAKREPDLASAVQWCALKSKYRGDANVMTKQEFISYQKGLNVLR